MKYLSLEGARFGIRNIFYRFMWGKQSGPDAGTALTDYWNSRIGDLTEGRSLLGVHISAFVFSICFLGAGKTWPTGFLLLPLCHTICAWVTLTLWNPFFTGKLLSVMLFYDSNWNGNWGGEKEGWREWACLQDTGMALCSRDREWPTNNWPELRPSPRSSTNCRHY